MGLTKSAMGRESLGNEAPGRGEADWVVALAGNPNVGKSTVFNALTGMNQHTGNWPGKTVTRAQGILTTSRGKYMLVDTPGAYSLLAHSAEEEVARNFICFGEPDGVIVVCDATCLERSMNLVLQVLEVAKRAIVCVNLVDEARKKGIEIDFDMLSQRLGVPVVPAVARKKRTLTVLTDTLDRMMDAPPREPLALRYPAAVERAARRVEPLIPGRSELPARWLALKMMDGDESLMGEIRARMDVDEAMMLAVRQAREESGLDGDAWKDTVVSTLVQTAERLCDGAVSQAGKGYSRRDRRIDAIVTGRKTALPLMLLMLAGIFWLTIEGANLPSQLLSDALFAVQDGLSKMMYALGAPEWLHGALVEGMYRTLAWVIAVMLPPMAIFFPLFTWMEDAGLLPRFAYNLDAPFRKCRACGKQALTMCMGFGCNAAGVVGCRIIDSPRERLIAILTNSFVPCNGRFPTLIALITMFFTLSFSGIAGSLASALMLTGVILLGVGMTFAASALLSRTVLRGVPSSFTLEMPPYRRPQLGKVLVRSILDRTLFVLGRAAAVAAPAGLFLWILANASPGGISLLNRFASALDPFGRMLGLDGVILTAFILGFPANEIVLPIALMIYAGQGVLTEPAGVAQMRSILTAHGWTWTTGLCVMVFSLFHWPCSTTLMTIRKETGSWKWTILALILPTAVGMTLCLFIRGIVG